MYQIVKDLKEEQYLQFFNKNNLQVNTFVSNDEYLCIGIAQDRKLVACFKIFIENDKSKKYFYIPQGFTTTSKDIKMYEFIKKHLLLLAANYNISKIIVSDSNTQILDYIGFKESKSSKRYNFTLDIENMKYEAKTVEKFYNVHKVTRKSDFHKLNNIKQDYDLKEINKNHIYYITCIDMLMYIDTLKNKKEINKCKKLMDIFGENIIIQSYEFKEEYSNVILINKENYLEEYLNNNIFYLLLKKLKKGNYNKICFQTIPDDSLPIKQNIYKEYEYNLSTIEKLIIKRRV